MWENIYDFAGKKSTCKFGLKSHTFKWDFSHTLIGKTYEDTAKTVNITIYYVDDVAFS